MSRLSKDVRKQIQDVKAGRKTWLDLSPSQNSGVELHETPDVVFALSQLERLNLTNNRIRIIPERIRELSNLKELMLYGNPIEKVPDISGLHLDWEGYLNCRQNLSPMHVIALDIRTGIDQDNPVPVSSRELLTEIFELRALRRLGIGLRSIVQRKPLSLPTAEPVVQAIIDRLGELIWLESLTLFGVPLGELPAGIRRLKRLQHLGVVGAGLRRLPEWISELRDLTYLGLTLNDLASLPGSLASLSKLRDLQIDCNIFEAIPEVLFGIHEIETIDISGWDSISDQPRIREIPSDILRLPQLRQLELRGQPIEIPPPEVVQEGVEAIKNYWRQQQEVGVDYLCEAKLLIVGEPGAGKTSLARKIEDPAYELKPREPSTEGIEVMRWSFPAAVRVKEAQGERLLGRDFAVNLWDFGGQEIYHATHQFFLTRRSLYLLVADDRKEDTDFNWWLEVVGVLSDGSPLLIVQNEKQGRRRDINLPSLRARFPNLKEACRTNLATNAGLDELISTIRRELERLPHIGTPLPATWKRVREALERDERNHIRVEEFLAICEAEGFKRDEDKLQLGTYLHDLGICLHFQDDPVLKHRVILKPKWATDAVYRC